MATTENYAIVGWKNSGVCPPYLAQNLNILGIDVGADQFIWVAAFSETKQTLQWIRLPTGMQALAALFLLHKQPVKDSAILSLGKRSKLSPYSAITIRGGGGGGGGGSMSRGIQVGSGDASKFPLTGHHPEDDAVSVSSDEARSILTERLEALQGSVADVGASRARSHIENLDSAPRTRSGFPGSGLTAGSEDLSAARPGSVGPVSSARQLSAPAFDLLRGVAHATVEPTAELTPSSVAAGSLARAGTVPTRGNISAAALEQVADAQSAELLQAQAASTRPGETPAGPGTATGGRGKKKASSIRHAARW